MPIKIELKEDKKSARMTLYGVVGWDILDTEVVRELESLDVDELELRLNSPGGDVFQGLAIYHRLREHPAAKTAIVDGAALSAMSVIMLAADVREVRKGGRVMVHEPHGFASGKAEDFRAYAEQMDITTTEVAGIYAERTNWSEDEAKEAMIDETWLTSAQALEAGFATRESASTLAVSAYYDPAIFQQYRHVPVDLQTKMPSNRENAARRLKLARARA